MLRHKFSTHIASKFGKKSGKIEVNGRAAVVEASGSPRLGRLPALSRGIEAVSGSPGLGPLKSLTRAALRRCGPIRSATPE